MRPRRARWTGGWFWAWSAAVLGPALVTAPLRPLHPQPVNAALAYLLVVLGASAGGGPWPGLVSSVASSVAFIYFFLPPQGTGDPWRWVARGAFLLTAVASSQVVARTRARSREAERRMRQTQRLLELSRHLLTHLAGSADESAALGALAEACGRALGSARARIRTSEAGGRVVWHPSADAPPWPDVLRGVAQATAGGLPRIPTCLRGPGGATALLLPLGHQTGGPALLVALSDAAGKAAPAPGDPGAWECATPAPLDAAWSLPQPPPTGAPGPRARAGGLEAELAGPVAALASLAMSCLHRLRRVAEAEVLRRSDDLKSALLSSVSHELRTPLAAMRVAATALQRPEVWADAADRQDLLRTVDEEAQRLNRVIANLLCMSRIQAGALVLERRPCDPEELVWEGVRQAGQRVAPARLRLALPETLPHISCDLGLAGTALANLLDNAAKYAPEGTPIEVGARVSPDGRLLAIWVEDHGPGIPPGEANLIFARFQRGHSLPVRPAGTGLGLPIARSLVEAHGGRLWVEAAAGGGSRFTSTWPVVGAGRSAAPPTGSPG